MIGKLLGHTQVQTTARYAHLARDSIQTAAARITGNINGNPRPTRHRNHGPRPPALSQFSFAVGKILQLRPIPDVEFHRQIADSHRNSLSYPETTEFPAFCNMFPALTDQGLQNLRD